MSLIQNNSSEELVLEPTQAQASIIWLHGLGADGWDFASLIPTLDLPEDAQIRFIFPHATSIPVTINGGMTMPAWYDILEMGLDRKVDMDGIRQSTARIMARIKKEENAGIPTNKILLAGFSQGGAIAIQAALRHDHALAGLMALSTYVVGQDLLMAERSDANQKCPILMAHGTYDPVVPYALAKQSLAQLEAMDYKVDFHEYPMEHSLCETEIAEIRKFIIKQLSANKGMSI